MHTIIDSPIGYLGIQIANNQLTKIEFLSKQTKLLEPTQPFAIKIVKQLQSYFTNPHYHFNVPYHLEGTPFQQKVWQALCNIPVGETLTYGDLAKQLKTSPRAIGNACRRNPIPVIVPCHRIVAQHNLGGFSGAISGQKLTMKTWLLQHEGYFSKNS